MTEHTFLLTDIESSTRLWERDWDAMAAAMTHHETVVSEAVASHDGSLLKSRGEGDSAFAVFSAPGDALATTLDLQRRFHLSPWPSGVALRVRAALHTGEAVKLHGDLVGPAVNRCARLRALAHGGQTLVSGSTANLVGILPPGAALRDLGTFTLRDLAEPERVLQLCHPDLRDDFPPPRAPHPSVEHLHTIVDDLALDLLRLPANAPTLGLSGRIELPGTKRSAFLEDVKQIFEPLSRRYGVRGDGDEYRIAFACYPEVVR